MPSVSLSSVGVGCSRRFFPKAGYNSFHNRRYLPDAIIGDLDSVRADVRRYYEGRAVRVIDRAADQDTTDLQKVRGVRSKRLR
jgi:thiamine pyrophosphokinase